MSTPMQALPADFHSVLIAAGGLLSTHIMLERKPSAVPHYDGALLRLAIDLGNRLLPAFDTKSGIPLSWIHLRKVHQRFTGELYILTCWAIAEHQALAPL